MSLFLAHFSINGRHDADDGHFTFEGMQVGHVQSAIGNRDRGKRLSLLQGSARQG